MSISPKQTVSFVLAIREEPEPTSPATFVLGFEDGTFDSHPAPGLTLANAHRALYAMLQIPHPAGITVYAAIVEGEARDMKEIVEDVRKCYSAGNQRTVSSSQVEPVEDLPPLPEGVVGLGFYIPSPTDN